jgi:hypothetical protein
MFIAPYRRDPASYPMGTAGGGLSRDVMRPGREADLSQPVLTSRKRLSIHSLLHTPSWRNVSLVNHRDSFAVYKKRTQHKNGEKCI